MLYLCHKHARRKVSRKTATETDMERDRGGAETERRNDRSCQKQADWLFHWQLSSHLRAPMVGSGITVITMVSPQTSSSPGLYGMVPEFQWLSSFCECPTVFTEMELSANQPLCATDAVYRPLRCFTLIAILAACSDLRTHCCGQAIAKTVTLASGNFASVTISSDPLKQPHKTSLW